MTRHLTLITGPIGAGKSTVADLLGRRLGSGRPTAVVDLDDVVFMQRAPDLGDVEWGRARVAHAALVAAWLEAGVEEMVVHGPICTSDEQALLRSHVNPDVEYNVALLTAPLDVTIERVLADQSRRAEAGSRVVEFLRSAHARFEGVAREHLGQARWQFDTTRMGPYEIAVSIANDLT